ncbi:hypothetical protein [Aliiroseovarius halocynthiae]|uniref:50S ribosomal protein L35 n=1 Tax=Aliiroseovarius halocynthiae TaxID=985055 RepID=A0A545SZI2_9RHOB|nr:hypothetical protein [Aliiroseovarius halocynthiae]TQV70339.1 hypothetical protein FIL88_00065 [Aliiroseovarius halocynthiae]
MVYDNFFVVGLFVIVLSVPTIMGALRRGDAPRIPAIMFLMGGGLVALAVSAKPDRYSLGTIPQVVDAFVNRWMAYFQA